MKKILLVVFPLLAACGATLIPFQSSRLDNSATLTISIPSTDDVMNGWVLFADGEMDGYKCSATPLKVIGILGNRSIYSGFADKGVKTNKITIKIDADGRPFRFLIPAVSYGLGVNEIFTTRCLPQVGFTPIAGEHYAAIYDPIKNMCAIELFREEDNKLKSTSVKSFPPCFDDLGRNFIGEDFVKEYYANHRSEYE